jgi:transcriptional regulator with XRE-family HTH domain
MKMSDVNVEVGKILQMNRKYCNIKQREVGKVLGVKANQICRYEKGLNQIPLEKLILYCDILSMPMTGILNQAIENIEKGRYK